jgi:hypothetical protein
MKKQNGVSGRPSPVAIGCMVRFGYAQRAPLSPALSPHSGARGQEVAGYRINSDRIRLNPSKSGRKKQRITVNNKEENFEARVSGQPLRAVPAAWRGEILAAARAARTEGTAATVTEESWLAVVQRQVVALLWPHPKAWAGLAAVWVGIIALNVSTQEGAPKRAEKTATPSPAMVAELKKQQRMFAELVGGYDTVEADRPRIFAPRPRSERGEIKLT